MCNPFHFPGAHNNGKKGKKEGWKEENKKKVLFVLHADLEKEGKERKRTKISPQNDATSPTTKTIIAMEKLLLTIAIFFLFNFLVVALRGQTFSAWDHGSPVFCTHRRSVLGALDANWMLSPRRGIIMLPRLVSTSSLSKSISRHNTKHSADGKSNIEKAQFRMIPVEASKTKQNKNQQRRYNALGKQPNRSYRKQHKSLSYDSNNNNKKDTFTHTDGGMSKRTCPTLCLRSIFVH